VAAPPRRTLIAYGAALAGVIAMTVLLGLLLSIAPPTSRVSAAYLIVVLVAATRLGRGPAIAASVASFLVYDFFFTTPYHELTISDPDEWVSLTIFLVTAFITGQVAASERARAEQATRREREAALLLDVLRLMGDPDVDRALRALAERVRAQIGVDAAAVELEIGDRTHRAAAGAADAVALIGDERSAMDVLPGVHGPTVGASARPRSWVRIVPPHAGSGYDVLGGWRRYVVPVRVVDRAVGRITLVRRGGAGLEGEDRFLAVVATQLSLLVQRAELEVAATEADVLRRASDLKTALLNAVSHDLRTPLASILASAGSLLQKDVEWSEEDREGSAREIVQEARRLDRIVGNLLDLSRIEAGALRPQKKLYDIASLIADVVARLERDAEKPRIVVHAADDLPPVSLDPVEIDQVLSNLIENALKNSPAGSPIDVSATVSGDTAVVEVADRGSGIPLADMPYLFEPFYRVRRDGSGTSGIGLGLAIAKGLIAAHAGRIWAEQRDGGGTRFSFALPVSPAHPAPEERTAVSA
jgi:two-component system, OmpR family, sensor histidine kinase KdpD